MPKKRKRSNGEGSVFPHKIKGKKTGKYRAQVKYRVNGKQKSKTKTANSHSDAVAFLKQLHEEVDSGFLSKGSETVEKYLKSWLDYIENNKSINSFATYNDVVNNHVAPYLGRRKLTELSPIDIENMIQSMRESNKSSKTIQSSYDYLKIALNRAVNKLRMIPENPCNFVDRPRHTASDANPLTIDQTKSLLKSIKGELNYCICYTALTTGMRIGELLGLFWENVDLDSNHIHVVQQLCARECVLKPPKTKSSIRTIEISEETKQAMVDHRRLLLKLGCISNKYVFCNSKGKLLRHSTFNNQWLKILKNAEIPHRGFHQLRHTFATMALSNGAKISVVSKTLGHAKTSMTLDIYAHVLAEDKSEATSAVSKLIS